jgi:hypothetical protein
MKSGRPRTHRVWTRLGDEEYDFLLEVKKLVGTTTEGEALRWLVQFGSLVIKSRMIALPRELMGGSNEREEGT